MRLPKPFRKRRRYPLKRDRSGKSARFRCFELFEQNIPLQKVSDEVGVNIRTVHKYHQQWRENVRLEKVCKYLKSLLDKKSSYRDETITMLSEMYSINKEHLEDILIQSHGLHRLVFGKIITPKEIDADYKRYLAFQLALLIARHLIVKDGLVEDVLYAVEELMEESREYRQEDVERTAFLRQMLRVFAEMDREGRGIRDRLTPGEREAILMYGARVQKKRTETSYWINITKMVMEGLTPEQAREKMHQDLIDSGRPDAAKRLRAFQDQIHPLKPDQPSPPKTS